MIEREFRENKKIFVSVSNYLNNQDYIYINISPNEPGKMYAAKKMNEMGKYVKITDTSISEKIDSIFKLYDYQNITKMTENIYFQRWSNLKFGRGLVYAANGKKPNNNGTVELKSFEQD
jgi:hypothetical protein